MKCILLDDLSQAFTYLRRDMWGEGVLIGVLGAATDTPEVYFCLMGIRGSAFFVSGRKTSNRIYATDMDITGFVSSMIAACNRPGDLALYTPPPEHEFGKEIGVLMRIDDAYLGTFTEDDIGSLPYMEIATHAAAAMNPLYQAILDYEEKL